MKHIAIINFVVLIAVFSSGVVRATAKSSEGVDLAGLDGWNIVVANDAIPSEIYAAEEFQEFFRQASGLKLPIVHKITRRDKHVFIGSGMVMQASPVGFSVEDLGPEDLHIIVRDDNIAIAGGRTRGTLYGVYTFLEDYLGVRFLTHDHTHVPKVGELHLVGPVDITYKPPFPHYRIVGSESAEFSVRQRDKYYRNDPKYGGFIIYHVINHSFYRQVPYDTYGKDHPEYFGLWDGKRMNSFVHTHLCLTNPDLPPIVTDAVLNLIESPDAVKGKNFSVSQNDTISQYCQCEKCQAVCRPEGSNMAVLLNFVNAVADEVAKKHPDVLVGTLAYGFSRKPPKTIKPRPNVQINLVTMGICHIHPITDPTCPRNAEFMREMKKWHQISQHLSIWDYTMTADNLLPYPNLRTLEPNIRAFAAAGVEGVFIQADPGDALEFSELRHYVAASLLWDPTRSAGQLVNEFLTLQYGNAASPIRQFINLVHNHYAATNLHHSVFIPGMKKFPVDKSVAATGLKLMRQALDLAENDEVKARVEKASICAYRAAIDPIWRLKKDAVIDPALADQMRPLAKEFFRLCGKYGLGGYVAGHRERIEGILANH